MTTTQTLQSTKVQTTRRYDYIYDPIFTLSSNKDHAKERYRAFVAPERVKRVPEYGPMFSSLNHFPSHQIQIDNHDPVPKFMPKKWRGFARTQPVPDPSIANAHASVSGVYRYKYSRRPIIPFLQQVPPDVLLQTTRVDPMLPPPDQQQSRAATPVTWTVGVQTMYRDSEAQTEPYTPDYVTEKGTVPELLTLASLSYKRGLPAGLAEVEMIERAREKRAWEEQLPDLDDVEQLPKRRQMMEEMERKEWNVREQEIEKLQAVRLQVLKQILMKREDDHDTTNTERLNSIWSAKQSDKEAKFAKLKKEYLKDLRKLSAKRENVEGKFERRNIVDDYTGFHSQVYAPKTRIGVFQDKGSELYNVKNKFLNTYAGLIELEHSIPHFVLEPQIRAPNLRSGKGGGQRRLERRAKELDDTADFIKREKEKELEVLPPPRFLKKVERPPPRPPTPVVEAPLQEDEERELSIIFIQQLIRGRAIQNMMQEGKEKRMELIEELKSTEALQDTEYSRLKEEKKMIIGIQRQQQMIQHKEDQAQELLDSLTGYTTGQMLDFLSKELVRLQEEQRIHAFALLAERKRRMREAEESGRRQVEERRRREEDEIWRQMCYVHQGTMESYLEDIISKSVNNTADEQSRAEIQAKAEKINEVAYELESMRDRLQSEEMVAELVYSFLLPEVEKETVRQDLKRQQRRHILAAHSVIHAQTPQYEKESNESDEKNN